MPLKAHRGKRHGGQLQAAALLVACLPSMKAQCMSNCSTKTLPTNHTLLKLVAVVADNENEKAYKGLHLAFHLRLLKTQRQAQYWLSISTEQLVRADAIQAATDCDDHLDADCMYAHNTYTQE